MPRSATAGVKPRFEAIVGGAVEPPLLARGFADATAAQRAFYPQAVARVFERRAGRIWHHVDVQRDKWITREHCRFTLNFAVLFEGFAALIRPGAPEPHAPVIQGRPAMLCGAEDSWWAIDAPAGPEAERADARVGEAIGGVIERDLIPLLEGLTTVEGLLAILEHPPPAVARAALVMPLSVINAAALCALTGRPGERDRFLALARERADLGPAHFPSYLDELGARLRG